MINANKRIATLLYLLVLLTLILLIYNISELNFRDLSSNTYGSIIANLLLLISQVLIIRGLVRRG
jgi:positive regulator of sigma E activity